jgi:arginyl-tRNA synthetase
MIATLPEQLQSRLRARVAQMAPDQDLDKFVVQKSKPGLSSDFQSAAAMQLSKVLRRKPREIADELVAGLDVADLAEVDVSGPGFIGFRLSDGALAGALRRGLSDSHTGIPQLGKSRAVVIDFSAPNVAKRMHIGHIRSTIIGDSLRRMGVSLGYRVIGDNHIGDWGTQFGQLIWAWRHWLDQDAYDVDPVAELERLYVEFNRRFKPKPGKEPDDFDAEQAAAANEAARQELAKLQAGDPDNNALWQQFIDVSRGAFDSVYARLGVHFDVTYGESHYNDRLQPLVDELLEQGIAEPSDGAVCIFFRDAEGEDELTPYLIRKRDGAALYATSDLATIEYRMKEWDPVRVLYVTDMRQRLHFEQLFAAARAMGVQTDLQHVWFGMMTLPEGSFSTRDGNVIFLHDLLDEAELRARTMLRERLGGDSDWTPAQIEQLAKVIGLGAVKYADLSNNPQSNVVFSFDKMLAFEGNTAPYLQYTSARACSLERKVDEEGLPGPDSETFAGEGELGRDLLIHLLDFGEAVQGAFDQGKPSLLATFLYELAQRYHRWYHSSPVLKEDHEAVRMSRQNLNRLARDVLARGLGLLGIGAPERM